VSFDLNTLEIAGSVFLFGYQMILFALFVRIFAYTRGFLPRQNTLEKAFRFFTLEKGLVCGALVLIFGIAVLLFAVFGWAKTGFGDLDPLTNTRIVIGGRTLVSLGAQTILFSLIFSYLGIDSDSSRK
jgi:hypothetical protein